MCVLSMHLTMLEHAIANGYLSVHTSVCHNFLAIF